MIAGHLEVLGGPHVARGPDVAQACTKGSTVFVSPLVMSDFLLFHKILKHRYLKFDWFCLTLKKFLNQFFKDIERLNLR